MNPVAQTDSPDWSAWRHRFPVLEKKTYLNSCSCGALSTDVTKALQRYINDRLEKGADWDYWVERNEVVRSSVALLIGAQSDEVAVTTSASAGINSLASALDFSGSRRKVVISDFEFPTNAQIWYAQELRGAQVVRVRERDGYIPVDEFEAAIDADTLIVAVTHVCYRNGARLDIPAIAELAHRHGAYLMVDGYQAFGTMAIDVHDSGIDFAAGGMVKYLLGTAGIGFLYVRQSLVEQLVPTVTGWFAQDDIFAMDATRYRPARNARRFETGTPPVPNSYAAEAGLAVLQEAGLPAIETRIGELTGVIKTAARTAGYSLATPEEPGRHGAMIAIRGQDAPQLVSLLEAENIVTSHRDNNLRVSLHFYNSEQDIETLFRALARYRDLLV